MSVAATGPTRVCRNERKKSSSTTIAETTMAILTHTGWATIQRIVGDTDGALLRPRRGPPQEPPEPDDADRREDRHEPPGRAHEDSGRKVRQRPGAADLQEVGQRAAAREGVVAGEKEEQDRVNGEEGENRQVLRLRLGSRKPAREGNGHGQEQDGGEKGDRDRSADPGSVKPSSAKTARERARAKESVIPAHPARSSRRKTRVPVVIEEQPSAFRSSERTADGFSHRAAQIISGA